MLEVKLLRHAEKRQELLDLFRASFGHDMPAEVWNWKHFQHPLASADPEVIVAMSNGKIVGAESFMPFEIWLKDEKVKAAQSCDTMVHPAHQRKGIFSQMIQFASEYLRQNGYALFYGFPGAMSRPGFLKEGWELVSWAETFCQLVNPRKIISYKLRSKTLGSGLGLLYDKLINVKKRIPPLSNSFQLKVSDQFTTELKEIDSLRDKSVIDLVRSESYLRWRFDQHPKNSYKYIVAEKDNELWGYAVVSAQELAPGLIRGTIIDYLVKDKDIDCFRLIINESLNEFRKLECDLVLTWMFSQPSFRRELLEYFGFKSSLKFPYNKFSGDPCLIVLELNERVRERVDIYNVENWRVTLAYSDSS